jgi:uncharacterized membrane protein
MQKRKRFYVALAIYAVLGLLIWAMMEDVPLPVGNGHIGIRSLTLIVLAVFALRTILHFRADQIRGEHEEEKFSS